MLKIQVWDEVDGEWRAHELDLPRDCRDATTISRTLDAHCYGLDDPDYDQDEDGIFQDISKSTDTGEVLVIVSRGGRGHKSIIMVNYLDQNAPADS